MARIRKVTKVSRAINMCSEESIDRKVDRSMMDFNSLNNRKLCNNDRNRRILLNLKSYPNLFLNTNFCSNLVAAVPKIKISASTQTSEESFVNGKKSMSTQTNCFQKKDKRLAETNIKFVRHTKSESSLNHNYYMNPKDSIIKRTHIMNNLEQCEDQEIHKNIIVLHKNEYMYSNKSKTLAKKETKIKKTRYRIRKMFNSRKYVKKNDNRQFHSYNTPRKFRRNSKSKEINACTGLYDQFLKSAGKYSLTTIAKCSSKLIKIVSEFGLYLTESFINLYKAWESQRRQSSNLKIDQLESKLIQLEDSQYISQAKIYKQQKWMDSTDDLVKKLEEVEKKLKTYDFLESELADIKKQLKGSSGILPVTTPTPPPPPPLPTFSLTKNCASNTFLEVALNDKKLKKCESSRPIITLDDILKVKLKKISVMTNI